MLKQKDLNHNEGRIRRTAKTRVRACLVPSVEGFLYFSYTFLLTGHRG